MCCVHAALAIHLKQSKCVLSAMLKNQHIYIFELFIFNKMLGNTRTSLVAQTVKRLSTMWETRVRSLGREDPLEKEMAIHSSTIAWKIRGQRSLVQYSLVQLQSTGSQRVGHD